MINNLYIYKLIIIFFLLFLHPKVHAQYSAYTPSTAMQLANTLLGEGVELISASMNCDPGQLHALVEAET